MKTRLKAVVVAILGWQLKRLRRKNDFKTIAVAGSYGKTSTKLAIARVLQEKFKVQYQEGNYNDITTVPLIYFGHEAPSLFNPFSWLRVFLANELKLINEYSYEYVVIELGTDSPGQIKKFEKYLQVDYALITSIAPEHMEFFDNVEEVAKEELSVARFSNKVFVNGNLSPNKLPIKLDGKISRFNVEFDEKELSKQWSVKTEGKKLSIQDIQPDNIAQLYTFANAAVICNELGLDTLTIKEAIAKLRPVPGRMNMLEGKKGSKIIDDTYNASPDASFIALKTLYERPENHRIALLGNMNELGGDSAKYHSALGEKCDPKNLDLVVTLGKDANDFTAKAAEKRGCKVFRADTPLQAGTEIEKYLNQDTVILAKGSQNGVFAEEAVKVLLKNEYDKNKLVRQSVEWLSKKQKSFELI